MAMAMDMSALRAAAPQRARVHLSARANVACAPSSVRAVLRPQRARFARLVVRAADAGAMGGDYDPYAVLEVTKDTPSDRILAQYNRLSRVAKMQLDNKKLEELEKAHNTIMMAQMRAAMSGAKPIDKSVQYADRRNLLQEYAPWRARFCPDEKKGLLITGAVTAVCWAWTLLASTDPKLQPLQIGTMAFFIQLFLKLNRLNPSPENPENPEKAKMDRAKFFRCLSLLLGFGAFGIVMATFVPVALAQLLRVALPAWIMTKESILVNLFATAAMGYAAAFTV